MVKILTRLFPLKDRNLSGRSITTLAGLLLLLIAIPLATYLVNQQTQLKSKAYQDNFPTFKLPLSVGVLVLEYYPENNINAALIDGEETGWKGNNWGGQTILFWQDKTNQMINQGLQLVNEATRYHGYKDPTAPQFLNYYVADRKTFYNPIPRGYQLSNTPNWRPNYGQILRNLNICDYVDNKGVREVWMYGYHNDKTIVPDESRMSSKYGDISNSSPHEEQLNPQYRMPICQKAYVLYNFTYNPEGSPADALHNRVHQVENQIPFAEGFDKWPPNPHVNTERGQSIFWGNFSEYVQDYTVRDYKSACGNGHITPNWTDSKNQGYRYDLTQKGLFNCETWDPDPAKTTYIEAGCERWGCSDVGFYKWWLQNIPGYNNNIVYQGLKMRNWWESFYDFNDFIDRGRSLFVSGTSGTITPTPPVQIFRATPPIDTITSQAPTPVARPEITSLQAQVVNSWEESKPVVFKPTDTISLQLESTEHATANLQRGVQITVYYSDSSSKVLNIQFIYNKQAAQPTNSVYLPTPTDLQTNCSSDGSSVNLNWSAVEGASQYQIRINHFNKIPWDNWYNAQNGDQVPISQENHATLSIKPGYSYYFDVQALPGNTTSAAYGPFNSRSQGIIFSCAPKNNQGTFSSADNKLTAVCLGPDQAKLSWDLIPGAVGYDIRIDNQTVGWTAPCTSSSPTDGNFCQRLNTNSFEFKVSPETYYQWWVHGVDSQGVDGPASLQLKFSCPKLSSIIIP